MHIQVLERACKDKNYRAIARFLNRIVNMANNNVISRPNGDGAPCQCCGLCQKYSAGRSADSWHENPENFISQQHYRAAVLKQFRRAMQENDRVMLKMFLDSGYVVLRDISLRNAAKYRCDYLVAKLIDARVDVNEQYRDLLYKTALHAAVRSGSLSVTTQLLDAGATVDVVDSDGFTELSRAIKTNRGRKQNGDKIAIKLLLAGADPNVPDRYGDTPFFLAAHLCRSKVIAQCIRMKLVDVCQQSEKAAWAPLDCCTADPHEEMLATATFLLDAGANVNHCDTNGYTALMRHVSTCDDATDVVRLFLRHGANVNARSNPGTQPTFTVRFGTQICPYTSYQLRNDIGSDQDNGHTALEQAACCDSVQIAKLLIEQNADVEPIWRWTFPESNHANGRPVLSKRMRHVLSVGKSRQEWRRLVDLALSLQPLALPVLVVYEIYLMLPVHVGHVASRFEAWKTLVTLKNHR